MKKIFKKLKRVKPIVRYIYYFLLLTYIVSFLYFAKNILALNNIENTLRMIILIIGVLYFLIYLFKSLLDLIQKKYGKFFLASLICLGAIAIFGISTYFLNPLNNFFSSITEKEKLSYTSYLISLQDTEFNDKSIIGRINDKSDIEGYKLAEKLYKEENLKNNVENYDDYIYMLNELKNKKIDAVFVPSNYATLFTGEEGLENIANETKIIKTFTEELDNQDKVEVSNKDFNEPLTFLIMGVDSEKNGLNASSAFNGDTLMVISFNPSTLRTTLVSFPRDTYVPIACKDNAYAKINSAAPKGTNCVIDTVSNLLDINIDYYAKINFKGVVELVDAVGGIDVDVEKPDYSHHKNLDIDCKGRFCEQNSDRLAGKHIIYLDPGYQTLNGEEALAYARCRYLYAGGDLDRIKHQQQVIEALASKILSFDSIADFQKILNAISNNMVTNMDRDKILSGYEVVKKMLSNAFKGDELISIDKAFLETYNLRVYVPSQKSYTAAQGYYKDSLKDIQDALKETLGINKEKTIKTFSFSAQEEYKVTAPGVGKKKEPNSSLLPSFVGKTVKEAEDYCLNNGLNCNVKYVDPGSEFYNEEVNVGLIGAQSPHENVLLQSLKDLTVYVVNSAPKDPATNDKKPSDKDNNKDDNDDDEIEQNIKDLLN